MQRHEPAVNKVLHRVGKSGAAQQPSAYVAVGKRAGDFSLRGGHNKRHGAPRQTVDLVEGVKYGGLFRNYMFLHFVHALIYLSAASIASAMAQSSGVSRSTERSAGIA